MLPIFITNPDVRYSNKLLRFCKGLKRRRGIPVNTIYPSASFILNKLAINLTPEGIEKSKAEDEEGDAVDDSARFLAIFDNMGLPQPV